MKGVRGKIKIDTTARPCYATHKTLWLKEWEGKCVNILLEIFFKKEKKKKTEGGKEMSVMGQSKMGRIFNNDIWPN